MKRIIQDSPQRVKVESIIRWPKCDFCGSCHPDKLCKCPRIKSSDEKFCHRRQGD